MLRTNRKPKPPNRITRRRASNLFLLQVGRPLFIPSTNYEDIPEITTAFRIFQHTDFCKEVSVMDTESYSEQNETDTNIFVKSKMAWQYSPPQ